MSNTTPVSSVPASGPWSGGPPGPRGAERTLHHLRGPCTGPLGWAPSPVRHPAGRTGAGFRCNQGRAPEFPGAVPAGSHGRRAGRSAAGTVSATGRRGPASPAAPSPSETQEALDAYGQPRAAADLPDGEEDTGHERGAVVGVVAQGQGLPRRTHEHLL